MKKKSVLVVTQVPDFHVPPVEAEVSRRGFTLEYRNLADFPLKMSLSVHLEGGTWTSAQEQVFNTFISIWYRRPELYRAPSTFSADVRTFLEREAYYAFIGLLESSRQTCLVSSPIAIQRAAFKPLHLAIAQQYGLYVPKTLITNEPQEVRAFYEECGGNVVCKSIYSNSIEGKEQPPRIIYTTLLQKEQLAHLEGVREGAHLFQEAFTACRDIRVTIVGRHCIATEIIYTQARSNVDWRAEYDKHTYIAHALPYDLKEKLLLFVKHYGLQYSAIDLLLVDGIYYFIDENANGQFYWLEQKNPNIRLASAMADLLCFPQENTL